MALSDSILLQIGQKKTSYNDLLTRILSNYSTVGSAKAALSRALKNLSAFEEIEKINDFYILTPKGKLTVESKLKNKILININNLLNKSKKQSKLHRDNLQNIDEIIKNLQMFIERSKVDATFLKIGKSGGTVFYVSDLELLKQSIDKRISHLTHLSDVLNKQIYILQDQNFEDIFSQNLNKNTFGYLSKFIENNKISKIKINCSNDSIVKDKFKTNDKFIEKGEDMFILKTSELLELKNIIFSDLDTTFKASFKIYLNEILVVFDLGKLYFIGPYKLITDIRKIIL